MNGIGCYWLIEERKCAIVYYFEYSEHFAVAFV